VTSPTWLELPHSLQQHRQQQQQLKQQLVPELLLVVVAVVVVTCSSCTGVCRLNGVWSLSCHGGDEHPFCFGCLMD